MKRTFTGPTGPSSSSSSSSSTPISGPGIVSHSLTLPTPTSLQNALEGITQRFRPLVGRALEMMSDEETKKLYAYHKSLQHETPVSLNLLRRPYELLCWRGNSPKIEGIVLLPAPFGMRSVDTCVALEVPYMFRLPDQDLETVAALASLSIQKRNNKNNNNNSKKTNPRLFKKQFKKNFKKQQQRTAKKKSEYDDDDDENDDDSSNSEDDDSESSDDSENDDLRNDDEEIDDDDDDDDENEKNNSNRNRQQQREQEKQEVFERTNLERKRKTLFHGKLKNAWVFQEMAYDENRYEMPDDLMGLDIAAMVRQGIVFLNVINTCNDGERVEIETQKQVVQKANKKYTIHGLHGQSLWCSVSWIMNESASIDFQKMKEQKMFRPLSWHSAQKLWTFVNFWDWRIL